MDSLPIEIFLTILTFLTLNELCAISCVNNELSIILKRYKFNTFYTISDRNTALLHTLNRTISNVIRFKNNIRQSVFNNYENYLANCRILFSHEITPNKLIPYDNELSEIYITDTYVSTELLEKLRNCIIVDIQLCNINNGLNYLTNCVQLTLFGTFTPTNSIIDFLKNAPNCNNLSITHGKISYEIFNYLKNIRYLTLVETNVEDFNNLSNITIPEKLNFTELILSGELIGQTDIEYILNNSNCERLDLSYCLLYNITPNCLKNIKHVNLSGNEFYDNILEYLGECLYLNIFDTRIDGSGFIYLKNLKTLKIGVYKDEEENGEEDCDINNLIHLTSLTHLSIENYTFDLNVLSNLTKLNNLELINCRVSGDLKHLLDIKNINLNESIDENYNDLSSML
jgi:hypothetical protein